MELFISFYEIVLSAAVHRTSGGRRIWRRRWGGGVGGFSRRTPSISPEPHRRPDRRRRVLSVFFHSFTRQKSFHSRFWEVVEQPNLTAVTVKRLWHLWHFPAGPRLSAKHMRPVFFFLFRWVLSGGGIFFSSSSHPSSSSTPPGRVAGLPGVVGAERLWWFTTRRIDSPGRLDLIIRAGIED